MSGYPLRMTSSEFYYILVSPFSISLALGRKQERPERLSFGASWGGSYPSRDSRAVKVHDGTRAADGASWFVSKPRNSKKVKQARWITTALGTYELYVNGKLVGNEVLKPGFTHYEKTKYAFASRCHVWM